MVKKLIDVDGDLWNKFAGACKMDGNLIGDEINLLLKNHLKKRGILPQDIKK